MGGRTLMASSMSRKGGWRRRWRRRGAELVLKSVGDWLLRSGLRSRCGGEETFSYDRTWAAQRSRFSCSADQSWRRPVGRRHD